MNILAKDLGAIISVDQLRRLSLNRYSEAVYIGDKIAALMLAHEPMITDKRKIAIRRISG